MFSKILLVLSFFTVGSRVLFASCVSPVFFFGVQSSDFLFAVMSGGEVKTAATGASVLATKEDSSNANTTAPTPLTEFPTIEMIMAHFTIDTYDARNNPVIHYDLLRKYKSLSDSITDPDAIRRIMSAELTVLRTHLKERVSKEFYWPEVKYDMFGYNFVFTWIMTRFFCTYKKEEDLPEWYRNCCKDSNEDTALSFTKLLDIACKWIIISAPPVASECAAVVSPITELPT